MTRPAPLTAYDNDPNPETAQAAYEYYTERFSKEPDVTNFTIMITWSHIVSTWAKAKKYYGDLYW